MFFMFFFICKCFANVFNIYDERNNLCETALFTQKVSDLHQLQSNDEITKVKILRIYNEDK